MGLLGAEKHTHMPKTGALYDVQGVSGPWMELADPSPPHVSLKYSLSLSGIIELLPSGGQFEEMKFWKTGQILLEKWNEFNMSEHCRYRLRLWLT